MAERVKVLASGLGSEGCAQCPGGAGWRRRRWVRRRSGARWGPSVAARGRLSAAAVQASGARRRARAHLYFAAGSLQPRAGLVLAPPLRHRELVDWPPEKQAHFPPPLSYRAGNFCSRPGAEWRLRGWGGGRDHSLSGF